MSWIFYLGCTNTFNLHPSQTIILTGKLTTCFNFSLLLYITAVKGTTGTIAIKGRWVQRLNELLWTEPTQDQTKRLYLTSEAQKLLSIAWFEYLLLFCSFCCMCGRGSVTQTTWLHQPGTKSRGCFSFEKSFFPSPERNRSVQDCCYHYGYSQPLQELCLYHWP